MKGSPAGLSIRRLIGRFALLLLLQLLAAAIFAAEALAPQKPNVLLITVESLRPDHLGCYGYTRPTSPVLDRFASEGVLVERAWAQAPWTSPAVVSILTGLYPPSHGVESMPARPEPGTPSIAKFLAAKGYNTPTTSYLQHYDNYSNLGFAPRDEGAWNGRLVEQMIKDLKSAPEPFFVWFHYKWTHLPYDAPEEFRKLVGAGPIPDTESIRKVMTQQILLAGEAAFSADEQKAVKDLYDAGIRRFDHDLGSILAVLDEKGIAGRTVVVILADHGEELFDHGYVGHASTSGKAKLYEENLRIPMIVKWPGVLQAGRRIKTMVRQIDVFQTLADLLGIAKPACIQGRSFAAPLKGSGELKDEALYAESIVAGFQTGAGQGTSMVGDVRDGRWKLIKTWGLGNESRELYDLESDPAERRNAIFSEGREADRLDKDFRKWRLRCLEQWFSTRGSEGCEHGR